MKKMIYAAVPAALLMFSITSCDKEDVKPTVPTIDTPKTNTPAAPTPYMPTPSDVNGALVAVQMNYKFSQMGVNIDAATEIGTAMFYGSNRDQFVDAGAVSINTIALEKQTNNSYNKTATQGMTTTSLNLDNGASWNVAGSGSVPAISYDHGSTFPSYSGDMPSGVTRADGITFSFTSSTVKNADSVYVAIVTTGKSVIKSYAATAGSVKISAADLKDLPAVSDNTAYLEVLPVKMTIRVFSGKGYAFIKEQAIVKNININ